jgi:hypothetical protein
LKQGSVVVFGGSLVVDVDSMVAVGGAIVAAVVVVDVTVVVAVVGFWLGCPILLLVWLVAVFLN